MQKRHWINKGCGPFLFCPGIRINQSLSEFIRINQRKSEFTRIKIRPTSGAAVYLSVWAAYLPHTAILRPYVWNLPPEPKNGFTGCLARSWNTIQETGASQHRQTSPARPIFALWRDFMDVCGDFIIRAIKRLYGPPGALLAPAFPRTPFKTPSAAHFITHLINCQMYF